MRIIGGALRGRRLAAVGKGDGPAHLRPTADRVRESLFNILAGRFGDAARGARVLDLFAGSGALGLEALSRGAAHVTFVESGRAALALLDRNIALCGVAAQTRVLPRDARRLGENADPPCDLVFADPPYGKALGEAALAAALRGGWIARDALIVWEESRSITPPDGFAISDERHYGDTVIRFLTAPEPGSTAHQFG